MQKLAHLTRTKLHSETEDEVQVEVEFDFGGKPFGPVIYVMRKSDMLMIKHIIYL